ncbi:MAG: MBL fold metallo-hydrolase [Acetobacteraceae bacterium]|nr:MBL fold metallo-hydrolase [Acetobacteraceae bacterium]
MAETAFICTTCGTQYPPSSEPPRSCPICEDARQYVNPLGQEWTTLAEMRQTHFNAYRAYAPGLTGVGTMPHFAIGQRALLVRTPEGNVLWDCISFLDQGTIEIVRALGGIAAIAISHPHYYTTMVEWSRAFGAAVYLHEADRKWVMRPDPCLAFWGGETRPILPGLTLIRAGGHFPGGTVLHSESHRALLAGDITQVGPDQHVSFMWSYPNLIPLDAASVRRIARALEPYDFDSIYGAFWGKEIFRDGKAVLARSVERYLRAISTPRVEEN